MPQWSEIIVLPLNDISLEDLIINRLWCGYELCWWPFQKKVCLYIPYIYIYVCVYLTVLKHEKELYINLLKSSLSSHDLLNTIFLTISSIAGPLAHLERRKENATLLMLQSSVLKFWNKGILHSYLLLYLKKYISIYIYVCVIMFLGQCKCN